MSNAENKESQKYPTTPEQADNNSPKVIRGLGKFALRVAETTGIAGAMLGSQELLFHKHLPIPIAVAVATTSILTAHAFSDKKK